jgi:hypothetical protein
VNESGSELDPDDTGQAPAVVVYRTTMLDGPVLSWFLNIGAARNGREVISASCHGVMLHGDVYLHTIRPDWLDAAQVAHAAICLGIDVRDRATHIRKPVLDGCWSTTVEPLHAEAAAG